MVSPKRVSIRSATIYILFQWLYYSDLNDLKQTFEVTKYLYEFPFCG